MDKKKLVIVLTSILLVGSLIFGMIFFLGSKEDEKVTKKEEVDLFEEYGEGNVIEEKKEEELSKVNEELNEGTLDEKEEIVKEIVKEEGKVGGTELEKGEEKEIVKDEIKEVVKSDGKTPVVTSTKDTKVTVDTKKNETKVENNVVSVTIPSTTPSTRTKDTPVPTNTQKGTEKKVEKEETVIVLPTPTPPSESEKNKETDVVKIAESVLGSGYKVDNYEGNGFIVYKNGDGEMNQFYTSTGNKKFYVINNPNEVKVAYKVMKELGLPLSESEFDTLYNKTKEVNDVYDKKSNVTFFNDGDDFHVTWYN